MRMRRLCAVPVVIALLSIAACGDDDDDTGGTVTIETTVATTTTDTTATSTSDAELPGEAIDLYPYEGDALAVVGVERGDTLAIRSGPGDAFDVVHELSPLATDVIATGHNRRVDDTIWAEVEKDGHRGWADAAFLLQLGATDDITEELVDAAGELPAGETMVDVANAVAELRASEEPPSRIAIVEDPEVGDLGSIIVDVIGLGDDAVGGERLHILAEPITEAFVVQSVQRVTLCSRGVTPDGVCI